MKSKAVLLLACSLVLAALFNFPTLALAHNEIVREDVKIVGGWGVEPPLVGQLNSIELTVTRISNGSPIANALDQLSVSVKKGGELKPLDFDPQQEAGVYAATIIPTQTGEYAVVFNGQVAGQAFSNGQIEIEDVGGTTRFEFPEAGDNPGLPEDIVQQLGAVITDLTAQVEEAKVAADEARQAAQSAVESSNEFRLSADRAYLFGIIGVGIGVAGVVIAVVALSRREKV